MQQTTYQLINCVKESIILMNESINQLMNQITTPKNQLYKILQTQIYNIQQHTITYNNIHNIQQHLINKEKTFFSFSSIHQLIFININNPPIMPIHHHTQDKQLNHHIGQLLAFIILFEKKIEELKIKLAGNQQFHSRLAFQLIDQNRKSFISSQDLYQIINRYNTTITIQQLDAFARKYTSNGSFSYDQLIKFFTPRTNKILAQRLMIRTYRQGTILPNHVVTLMLDTFVTAITMTTITQNLRKQLHTSTQLTHLEILQFFRKCCTSRQKLFYFINASTNGEGDYDFTIEQMDLLTFHVRGKCQLEDISDQQIKEILCPLDMNYQKNYKTLSTFGGHVGSQNKTQYFKTKNSFLTGKSNENEQPFRKTVNFLRTNYQQTSKNFYQPGTQRPKSKMGSKEMYLEPLDENVQTRPPTPMMNQKYFPQYTPYLVLDHYSMRSKGNHLNGQPQQSINQPNNDGSEISSINYGNLYIQKFTRGSSPNNRSIGYSKKLNFGKGQYESRTDLDNILFQKMHHEKKKEMFYDEFNSRNYRNADESDLSQNSAFLQY